MEIKHFHVRLFHALVIALGAIFQTSEAVVAKLITVNNLFRVSNKFESIAALITTALSCVFNKFESIVALLTTALLRNG